MVLLGLIKSPDQAPAGCHRVSFRRVRDSASGRVPGLSTSPQDRTGRWELSLPVDPDTVVRGSWAAAMALVVSGLDWQAWWLDVESLTGTTGLAVGPALQTWGRGFWPLYKRDGVVYFLTGRHRREVLDSFEIWRADHHDVRRSREHDLETRHLEAEAARRASPLGTLWSRLKDSLRPSTK